MTPLNVNKNVCFILLSFWDIWEWATAVLDFIRKKNNIKMISFHSPFKTDRNKRNVIVTMTKHSY